MGKYSKGLLLPGAKSSRPSTEKKSFGDRALQDLRDIVTSIPKIPKGLLQEAEAVGGLFSGDFEPPKELVSKKGSLKTKAAAALSLPGVRLIPGTYAGAQALRGGAEALGEHPLFSALDVLPYVGRVTRTATTGTRIAAKAGERAATLGKIARAERIAKRGLEPRQLVGEIARSAEEAVVAKAPKLAPYAPSNLLELSGLGGARMRSFMETLGIADRKFQNAAVKEIEEAMGEAKNRGITPQRATEIASIGQKGAPGWRQALAPNEQGWLNWYENKTNAITQKWIDEGKLFQYGGETYSASGNRLLQKALRRADYAARRADSALTPVSANSKRAAGTWRGQTSEDWLKMQREALTEAERLATRATPARFKPMIEQRVREAAADLVRGKVDDASLEPVVNHILAGDYRAAGAILAPNQIARLRTTIKETWQQLRAEGHDPVYLHHVPVDEARKLLTNPRLVREVRAPGFTKNLSWDMRPWVHDMGVSLSAQAVENLKNIHARALFGKLQERGFLRSREAVESEVRAMVQAGAGKGADVATRMDDLLARMYTEFKPESIFPTGRAGVRTPGQTTLYLPKGLESALRKSAKQADLGRLAKIARIPMSAFRFSILTLSPAYYVDNVVSGAVMLAAHNPTALRFLPKAIRMMREGTIPEEISRGARLGTAEAATQIRKFQAGRQIGQILDEAGKVSLPARLGEKAAQIPRGLNALASAIDDMYKTMGFLSGEKQALRQGLSKEAARQAGVELAHKVLVNFDRLTPIEKTLIRAVVPFYSWSQHLLRYVMSYPFDHPWRAAIVTALARNLSEEWPEGLPERFKTDLFFAGDTKRIGMTGPFPMLAAPDYFTAAGVLSRLNPALQSLMEITGADPFTYAPPVYGARETAYDPVSGREIARRPSLVDKALETVSPQIKYLWSRISKDPEWIRLVEANPEAARAAAWRAFGIRIPREIDIQEEIAKAREAQQKVSSKQARAQKVSTGKYSEGIRLP